MVPGGASLTRHMAGYPVFAPHSAYARSIAALSHGVLIATLGILLLVIGLVAYATRKFRERPGKSAKLIYGNTRLEVGYTAAFVVILGTMSVFSIRAMETSDPPTREANDLLIVAHQWWWEVRYPKTDIVTANEIHIPVNQPQQVGLRSADVIHDFWVPELGRKMDIIPGAENRVWIAADSPGVYYGACAEYCGKEHAWMRIRVIAQSPADFARWEGEQEQAPALPQSGLARQGAQYFQQLSCASCHTIRGTAASARIGPDLTHVASRETLAAGRLDNTPANLSAWLLDPELIKPGCKMPNLHLSRQQQQALVAYLEGLR